MNWQIHLSLSNKVSSQNSVWLWQYSSECVYYITVCHITGDRISFWYIADFTTRFTTQQNLIRYGSWTPVLWPLPPAKSNDSIYLMTISDFSQINVSYNPIITYIHLQSHNYPIICGFNLNIKCTTLLNSYYWKVTNIDFLTSQFSTKINNILYFSVVFSWDRN